MAQNHMKQQADKGRSECQFVEGDQVSGANTQILWSVYHSQASRTSILSVSFAQPFEATSSFSCFMLKEGDWN
jgi:hypothetical protein